MADVFSKKKRSQIMSKIRAKDTKPEIWLRKELHRLGFRYRLHDTKLPGKPDLKLAKYNAVILIHGCFWHGHNCRLFRMPKTNKDYWNKKILNNKKRDDINREELHEKKWRILIMWECAIKGPEKKQKDHLISEIIQWLHSNQYYKEITGDKMNNS